jgi:hypothetical protein
MATFLVMAVPFATSVVAAVPFVLIMAVPFTTSFVADVPFVYYNGCSICIWLFHLYNIIAVPFATSLMAAVPFVLIIAVPFAT